MAAADPEPTARPGRRWIRFVRRSFWVLLAVSLAWFVVVVAYTERRTEMDLGSGQLRRLSVIWGYTLKEEVQETDFSRMAVDQWRRPARWRVIGSHRIADLDEITCYRHSMSLNHLQGFVCCCRVGYVPDAQRAALIDEILGCLEKEDIDALGRLIRRLEPKEEAAAVRTERPDAIPTR